ncbi:MAG: hypothetical protein M3063_05250, partial [Actinomycetota bacterium]|nr:hypothetical protein [Actinomycetota bacterium]
MSVARRLLFGLVGLALEVAEELFVASDFGGDGFEPLAELVEFDDEPGEGVGFAVAVAVFF